MPSKELIQKIWDKTIKIRGKNPNLWRRDSLGNLIYRPAYGKEGKYGWEIDHKVPKKRGGSDSIRNLQALQTRANREKSDKR